MQKMMLFTGDTQLDHLAKAVSCGHTGSPGRRREALVGLDPTVPLLILGELIFNTRAENYPSPSQQNVFRGITQCSVQLGNAAPCVGHALVTHHLLCVHTWATTGEEKALYKHWKKQTAFCPAPSQCNELHQLSLLRKGSDIFGPLGMKVPDSGDQNTIPAAIV